MSKLDNKTGKLEWYCLEWDFNKKQPRMINIMLYIDIDDLKKKIRYRGKKPTKYNSVKNRDELREYLRREFIYYFWSKCEHEIIVNSWPCNDASTEAKIDVFFQIEPNLDVITEYVIHKLKLDFKKPTARGRKNEVFSEIKKGLEEAIAYEAGEEPSDAILHKISIPEDDSEE